MGIWQKLTSKVKKWFGGSGGGSTKRKKKEPPQPRAVSNNRDARNQTVSSRTGTGSTFNKRELVNSLKAQKKEEDRVKEAFKAKKTEYKSLSDASKSDPKTEAAKKSRAEMRKKLDAKRQENKEWHEVTNNRFNVGEKGISDEERKRRQQNVKSQAYDEKTAVKEAEHQMKWHGKEMSFARGALSGATFGASDLAAKKLTKGEARKAEEVYQQNKSKGLETAGEIAGSLASFGLTAGATEKAAAKIGSKVAPKAAERLAERQIIKNAAKRSVNKAVEKGLVSDATEELIKQVGKDKAKKIVRAVGTDIVQNATTGLIYDFNKASTQYEIGSPEWLKEMGKSAAFNAAITGGIAGGSMLTGGKQLVKNAAEELGNRGVKGFVKNAPDAKVSLNRRRRADVVLPNKRPASAISEDDIDEALIESATTTEDFMNFFGLDRATAKILAEDKARQASREVASAASETAGNGIPRGNIKPIAENLRANDYLPRSRNAEWRAVPRSAKRVDTSIEGMTKQIDELKGKTWQTDRERRAIETKINDVEDRLNRAKWRREGGADMDAMQKAYRGEYQGFDMGKFTNSHQSDALEGKLKGKTATIVEMSPDEYIERTYRQIFKKPTEKGEAFSRIGETQKNVEKYAEAMRNGEKFPLPYLDYSAAQQEGRHRALAAKAAGIDKIPVVIIDDEANPKAIINEVSEATAKTKNWMDSLADSETYDDFVKQNAKNEDLIAHMQETGKAPKEIWQDARIERGKQNLHRISDEEADRILYEKIPENEVQGWFNDANSGYKPRILERMAESPDTVNASLNVAYKNYLDSNPKNALSFDEWLDTPQTLYRGIRGQSKTADDIFSAFTPYKEEVASKFAGENGSIEEISITPRETYGSIMHNLESEFLVPESAIKESATPAPKSEVAIEPPKATSKKKKVPPTREERLANSNGVDQYNARAEHQAQRFEEGYGKADNIRAALAGEEPKAPAKGAKPAAERLNAKAQTETKNINLDDTVGKKRERKTFREQFHDFASSVKTKVSDSLNAFEEENKKFIRSDHQKWLENVGAIDKTRRSGAIASRSIGEAQVKWNGDVFEGGKSLKSIYDGMDEATEKDFDKYLLLKHAPDRIREGKPIFAGTQYDSAEACEKAAKELLDKHPEFAERAEDLYRYTRNELQNRVDAGLIKQEVVDEWRKKYPNYVPTGRDGDFGGEHDIWDLAAQLKDNGNTVGAGEIKKAKGGDQPIRSIKEQLADATSRNWRDMSMNNLFRKMFGDKVADELATSADGGLEKVLDNTISLSKTKDGGKYFAEVFEDGEMKRVNIDKRFYDAIEDLYKNGRFGNGIDVMTDAASKVAYPFKNLVTSWNPIFMVKNGLRDFPEAVINSRQTKEFLQIMAQGDAMRELKNGGEFLQAFRNSGVSQANFVNLEEALTKGDNWLKKGVNKFATLQEMVETYPRLIEYMATIKRAGYDLKNGIKDVPMEIRDIAAANAADVTVNFGRSGSVGKMLNRGLVPFFNPSVQGWSKFLRNYSEQSGVKSTLGLILKAAAIGTGATALNNFLLEDNPNYQQISARDKATNYIIPLTWGKNVTADNTTLFIKIPKSRFAAAYSLPAVNTNNENKMGWAEMIKVAGDQVAPVDPSESHILAPLLDATKSKEGETWYGTPIVPQALVDLPKSEQYDVNTSWFGKTLGKATAGLPEELQISPKKADYIIDAETGVIGDLLLPASTPSKQGSGNWAERHITHPMGNVVKKSFTIDSTTQNNLSTRFYDQLENANTKNQSAKAGKAESDEYKRLNSYSTEISGINKTIRALQGSKRETKVEDVRGLQEFRNQLMQDAIDGKGVPNSSKTLNTVQKHAGTTYAINNFGSSADKKAMKLYGMAKYGDISKQDMRKAINDDKDFFKGVKSISALDAKMEKAGIKSNTTLSKAVALASSDSSDELFGAYEATKKSRTETDNKMNRARAYFKDGGSEDEYVKLETARKTMGKLTDFDESAEIEKAEKQLAKGEISLAEYHAKEDSIKYNANISYIGLATSLAQANAPERGYRLYDIKDKNIQKGINLAAMGFTARDYRRMAKELDTDGNGYPSSKEIRAYVANSDVRDKATLYDALYYYKGKYNPFGTPTNYTRAQAAAIGNSNGIKSISDDTDDFDLKAESGGGGYGGYYRRGYRRRGYRRRGGGSTKVPAIKKSAFKAEKAKYTDLASALKKVPPSTTKAASTVKIEPPNVKFKKYEA